MINSSQFAQPQVDGSVQALVHEALCGIRKLVLTPAATFVTYYMCCLHSLLHHSKQVGATKSVGHQAEDGEDDERNAPQSA